MTITQVVAVNQRTKFPLILPMVSGTPRHGAILGGFLCPHVDPTWGGGCHGGQ